MGSGVRPGGAFRARAETTAAIRGLWRHLGLLQGHLLHPDLLRAELTDGQVGNKSERVETPERRKKKQPRNLAKFQLT